MHEKYNIKYLFNRMLNYIILNLLYHDINLGYFNYDLVQVEDVTVQRLCRPQVITAVNGSLPGPTLYAREGDTVIIHLVNKSPYNMTIHW